MIRYNLIIICFLNVTLANAQTDTTYVVERMGMQSAFTFRKSANTQQLRAYTPASFPVYTMNKSQYNRMRDLLYIFVEHENDYDSLLKVNAEKIATYELKQKNLTQMYDAQELRAKNFEESYKKLEAISQTLDANLKKCEDLAKSEHKRKNRKSFLIGLVSAGVGLVIGAAAF